VEVNEHDTLPPGGMGPLDPTDIRERPGCGHFRHWDEPCRYGDHTICADKAGHTDFEHCDECGKEVCFDIDCANGWRWTDGGTIECYDHDFPMPSRYPDGTMVPTYEEHMS
jgi:hypothetical protein